MKIGHVFTLLTLLAMVTPAAAWDDQGHMMVAAVAYDQLAPATKTRVAQLLALSAYPTNGVNNANQTDAAKAAFMLAATAPDTIKKDPHKYTNDGEDPDKAPAPGQNIGFADKYMHKYWHYVDLPFSPDGTPLQQPPSINAQERITLFRNVIASNAPDELKSFDLVWLLHLVGDVHQPLHATSRFTQATPKGDNVAGHDETVSAAINAARALSPPDPALASERDEAV